MRKTKITKTLAVILAAAMTMGLTACGGGQTAETTAAKTETTAAATEAAKADTTAAAAEEDTIKAVLITGVAGLGDRSFNDSAWAGLQRAEEELGIEIAVIEPETVADFNTAIVSAAESGADVILGFGANWADAFDENCEKFPEIAFGGMNCNVVADNLQVARTADHEGSFLAGALAALMSESGTIGGLGAQDADNINRFLVGYEEGAKYVKPEINVLKAYVGSFTDPAKGKEYSQQLMGEGADVIFHVAAGTGEGLFEAAKENEGLYAIGVDSDQDYIAEGKILTSMVKNCDVIAYNVAKAVKEGTFAGGDVVYGLENGGVGLSEMKFTKDIIGEEVLGQIEDLKAKIIAGEIKVTDVFAQ